jgi:hypothetical protein
MFRFSIREILLLTVVVALGFGWWLHSSRQAQEISTLREKLDLIEAFESTVTMIKSTVEPSPFGSTADDGKREQ